MDDRRWLLAVAAVAVVAVASHVVLAPAPRGLMAVHVTAWVVALVVVWRAERNFGIIRGALRRARSAVDLLDDVVVVIDAVTYEVAYANRGAATRAGAPVTDVIGRPVWDVGSWPELEVLLAAVDGNHRDVDLDGRVMELRGTRVLWESERAWVLLLRDVTETRGARALVEQRERRFRDLAESAPGMVYRLRVRPELELEYVNGAITEVLGFRPAEFHVDPHLLARQAAPDARAALDLRGPDHVYDAAGVHAHRLQHAAGHWSWFEDHHTAEHDDDGQLVAVQGMLLDMSAVWRTEQALGEAQRDRESANETLHRTVRAQQTFIRSMSHELRTPLTAALGFARMLESRGEQLAPEVRSDLAGRLVSSVERLDLLVGQLTDFDDFARDEVEFASSLHRLDEVVAASMDAVDLGGRRLRRHLELVVAPVDAHRVGQLVQALLRNVVEHTPSSTTADVSLTIEGEEVVIVVADDGPGVDTAVRDSVFAPFVQAAASRDAANPGLGLGLATAQLAARLHGGDLTLADTDQGARFVARWPLSPPDGTTPPVPADIPSVLATGDRG